MQFSTEAHIPSVFSEARAVRLTDVCEKQKYAKDFFSSFCPGARIPKYRILKIPHIAAAGANDTKMPLRAYIANFTNIKNPRINSPRNIKQQCGHEFSITPDNGLCRGKRGNFAELMISSAKNNTACILCAI